MAFYHFTPDAILDVNSTSAMIIPSGNTAQRPSIGVTAMIRNNTDTKAAGIFWWHGLAVDLAAVNGNSAAPNRVNLVRGLAQGDSIYYNIGRKKFVFTDQLQSFDLNSRLMYSIPVSLLLKGTASSVFHRCSHLNFPSVTLTNNLFDVDNDSIALANPGQIFYNGMRVASRMLPSAHREALLSVRLSYNWTMAVDTVLQATAIASNSFIEGRGYTGSFVGFQTVWQLQTVPNNVGSVMVSAIPFPWHLKQGRVNGNVMGYFGNMAGFKDNGGNTFVDGNAYGIFLSNVAVAGPRRNFAFSSNKGLNRFADSTLITDRFFTTPVLKIGCKMPPALWSFLPEPRHKDQLLV